MTLAEASSRAATLGLVADERFGWCFLRAHDHGAFVVRGGTWQECFARLGAAPAEKQPVAGVGRAETDLFSWNDSAQ